MKKGFPFVGHPKAGRGSDPWIQLLRHGHLHKRDTVLTTDCAHIRVELTDTGPLTGPALLPPLSNTYDVSPASTC